MTCSTRTEKLYRERYGRGAKGAGWYSFDANGVHFIGLVNVVDLKAGGLGNLGNEQLEWLEDDLKGRSASTPIVVFAHIPLWTSIQPGAGAPTTAARALDYLKRFGSVTVLNGHIHQIMQKVEGNVTFHTAMSTAFPQPAPGAAPSPGPMKVADDKLRSLARRHRRHLQAWAATARDHRQAAAGLSRESGYDNERKVRIATALAVAVLAVATALPAAPAHAERGAHRRFRLRSAAPHREGRHDRYLDQRRRHPAHGRLEQRSSSSQRRWIRTTNSRSRSLHPERTSISAHCIRT